MNDDHTRGYAEAVLAIARAEGAVDAVEDELRTIARALEANDELRGTLTDRQLPLVRRLAFVDDQVLADANPATRSAVAMLIAAEHAGQLPAIASAVTDQVSAARDRVLAEVTVAIELDEQRREALAAALERATGQQLDVRFTVDEDVVGGVRAQIGDTVIDGSLLRRLDDLRSLVGL